MRWLVVLATASCATPEVIHEDSEDRGSGSSPLLDPDPWAVAAPDPWAVPSHSPWPAAPVPTPPPVAMPASLTSIAELIGSQVDAPPASLIASVHNGFIALLAVSEDGTAALTSDGTSLRLWPTLDGTREPIVVTAPAPAQLALTRQTDGFSIALVDHAGHVTIVRTTGEGLTTGRTSVELARPIVELHAVGAGFIAVRDDRAVVAFDHHGHVVGTLTTEPGVRVAALAVRNARVLAMLDVEGKLHARWITIGSTLAWGTSTPTLAIAPERVALSPDHRQLAGVAGGGRSLVILDVATGKRVARPIHHPKFQDTMLAPLGFLDDGTLALHSDGRAHVWRKDAVEAAEDVEGFDDFHDEGTANRPLPAIANGTLVNAVRAELRMLRPGRPTQSLGYRMGHISSVQPRRDGWLLSDGVQAIRIDHQFRERGAYAQPKHPDISYTYGLTLLDGDHALTTASNGRSNAVYVIDYSDGTVERVVEQGSFIAYEASTQIAAFQLRDSFQLARFDRKTGRLGPLVTVPDAAPATSQLVLLPRGATGIALRVTFENTSQHASTTVIRKLDGLDARMGATKRIALSDAFWNGEVDLPSEVTKSQRGQTSPDGAHSVELDGLRIRMRDAAGTERWAIASTGVRGLAWTPTNELIAFGSGMAQLDVATGAKLARQCGWRFGIWTEPTDIEVHGHSVFGSGALCEAE